MPEAASLSFHRAHMSHLMQLYGSLSQSVLHLNLSQANQPMGGVRANPFSKAWPTSHMRHTEVNEKKRA